MLMTPTATTGRVLLKNISLQTYESLLKEMGYTRTNRLTYDRGLLEIVTPSMPYEGWKRLIENLIVILAQELQLNLKSNDNKDDIFRRQVRQPSPICL